MGRLGITNQSGKSNSLEFTPRRFYVCDVFKQLLLELVIKRFRDYVNRASSPFQSSSQYFIEQRARKTHKDTDNFLLSRYDQQTPAPVL
jgi:hypothetical protein